jgi:ParB/RepB/Spo0J family partition protein
MTQDRIEQIPLSEIIAGDNDRLQFNEDALQELADSIAAIGLAQPITVRPLMQDGEAIGLYQIVAGERRFRACKLLGLETMPALVRSMSDSDAARVMLAENLQRVDISPLEAAKAFRKRIDQFGWTVAEIAAHANVRPEMVSRRLKLLGLCPEAAFLLERNNLPIGHAEVMAALDSNRQMLALRLFQGSRAPSLQEFRAYCSQLMAEQSQESMFDLTEFTLDAQEAAIAAKMQRTGAGVRQSDRVPAAKPRRSIGETIEAYVADLLAEGCGASADAICSLYDALVRSNLARVPDVRSIPETMMDGYQPAPRRQAGVPAQSRREYLAARA